MIKPHPQIISAYFFIGSVLDHVTRLLVKYTLQQHSFTTRGAR